MNDKNTNKQKKKRGSIALNCMVGALALLGSAGTITFGTLWCHSRKNPDTPSPTPSDNFYTITLDLDGGQITGLTGTTINVVKGATYGLLPSPKKDEKAFNGWLVNGEPVSPTSVIPSSVSVKASWVDAPTPPTPSDNKIEWSGNLESYYDEELLGTVWDVTNKDEYQSYVEPAGEQIFSSNDQATKYYASEIINDNKILTNDYMISMIDNMLLNQWIPGAEFTLAWCPKEEIDAFHNIDDSDPFYEWESSSFTGTIDFSVETTEIAEDTEHNCLRISMESFVTINFSYTLTDPDGQSDPVIQSGYFNFDMVSKKLPFIIGYRVGEEWEGHLGDTTWYSSIPDDFCYLNEESDPQVMGGWCIDDADWSFEWHPFGVFGLGAESTLAVPITTPLFNQFFGLWNKAYINELLEKAGDEFTFWFLSFIDLTWKLTEDQNNNGINYLRNCRVGS